MSDVLYCSLTFNNIAIAAKSEANDVSVFSQYFTAAVPISLISESLREYMCVGPIILTVYVKISVRQCGKGRHTPHAHKVTLNA